MNDRAKEIAEYSQRLHARGWVANHDGNVSVRDGSGRYLATPTATSKAAVRADGLVVVDDAGKQVAGRGKPFSEIGLHLTVFANRSDVNAVVHAHPPTATGFAVAGVPLDEAFLAEAVVSLGAGVPTVPFAAPGPDACRALAPYTVGHDAVLLAGHGVLTWGPDLETAYLRMELVEHLARIALVARQLGGARPLPSAVMPKLLESRAKAGLGRAASAPPPSAPPASAPPASMQAAAAGGKKVVVACAPAPPGSDVEVYDPKRAPRAAVLPSPTELASIIRQEIAAALKK
ncbi:MAG TPA: class II aldolase/adducin family protein [Polyangia bacterium]|nr:class II aldolase/adducin family protein [Polyangia bacterium]